jgi:hypothetical protein
MNADSNMQRLAQEGDPFERLISGESVSLFQVLSPYARVWLHHIFPRRVGDGSHIVEEWQPFASSHYTALIRLYHAYCSKKELISLCTLAQKVDHNKTTAQDYELLLRIHSTCAAFWENLGSSIDNFAHAWDDARRLFLVNAKTVGENGDEKISGRTISPDEFPQLSYAFDRRTQFIHSVLVPKKFLDGQVIFNLRHYDEEKTTWLKGVEEIEAIDTQIETDWESILKEFGGAWEKLYSWVQSRDKDSHLQNTITPGSVASSSSSGFNSTFTIPPSS